MCYGRAESRTGAGYNPIRDRQRLHGLSSKHSWQEAQGLCQRSRAGNCSKSVQRERKPGACGIRGPGGHSSQKREARRGREAGETGPEGGDTGGDHASSAGQWDPLKGLRPQTPVLLLEGSQ